MSLDRRESRVCFGPVGIGIEQVKVDVGARGLKLGWVNMEQDTACKSVPQGKEQDASRAVQIAMTKKPNRKRAFIPWLTTTGRSNQLFVTRGTHPILSARQPRDSLSSCVRVEAGNDGAT